MESSSRGLDRGLQRLHRYLHKQEDASVQMMALIQTRAAWDEPRDRHLAAQVLFAQEAERKRVCREMHDDLAQRVALLDFDIERMKQRFQAGPLPLKKGEVLPELDSLHGSVALLADDLHRICERLHPAVLDSLGLVCGIESLCRDHCRLNRMKVSFVHDRIPESLPDNVSLCLYRMVQETLRNAAKYSGAKSVTVTLRKIAGGIRAVVRDDGRGFQLNRTGRPGLGLVFLAERVRLLAGRCAVRSAPAQGTSISAWVPVLKKGAVKSMRAVAAA